MSDAPDLPDGCEFSADTARVDVDPSVRGKGVGTAFVGRIRDHLRPFGLRRILLATEDAQGVYEKVGFRPLDRPGQWMIHPFE
ncbi:GNAT family N-acetyltransferase [Streptomyces sp. NPDC001450]